MGEQETIVIESTLDKNGAISRSTIVISPRRASLAAFLPSDTAS
jgi:hypothetical protein